MILKILRPFQVSSTNIRAKHTFVAADTFEGKIIKKSRLVDKRNYELVKYGGKHIVTLLPGAPPGPKLMSYVKDIFKLVNAPVDFEEIPYSGSENEQETMEFGKLALTSMFRNGVGLKGNIHSSNLPFSANVVLRQQLDLYIYVVHAKSYPHVKCKYPNMDLYICRQNTEGEYAMLEHSAKPGIVESLKIITEENTSRFADWCFKFALEKNRKKVTIAHKANIMKLSDGLFMKVIKNVAKSFPQIEVNDIIIDNATMQLVQNPAQFDMFVTPNLYGNILSNIACGLIGSGGLVSGKNFGPSCALFEAGSRHLTYVDEINLNPIAMLNASKDLLYYIGKPQHAEIIDQAIIQTLSNDKVHTHDLGGTNTCEEVINSVKANLRKLLKTTKIPLF